MRYLYTILLLLLALPIYAVEYIPERDSSIHVVRGNMQKLQDELIISFELSVDRELSSNESVVLEPIVFDTLGRLVVLPKIYINSRRQHIMYQRGFYGDVDLSKTLQRKNGSEQRLQYLEALPYAEWMKASSLIVNEESCGCGLPISSDIAFTQGITNPFSMPDALPRLACVMPEEVDLKLRVDKGSAFILFPLNKTVLNPSFGDNKAELDKITNSIDIIKRDTTCTVRSVNIHGYASPEGPYKLNDKLSRGRTDAVKEYVNKLYHFPSSVLTTEHTPEDWLGFEALLYGSTYEKKGEILKIINSDIAPDKKESEIRTKYPQFFKMVLNDWFVLLRHTDYTIEYEVCFFNSIEEIERIYGSNPKNLSLNELFQLYESYPEGTQAKEDVLITSVELNPEDPIANINAAGVALRRRDLVAAKRYLDQSPECGEKDLASGVYYLLIGDYGQAGFYLKRAEALGVPESRDYMLIYQTINQ